MTEEEQAELLDALEGVLIQATGKGQYGISGYTLDSGFLTYYAEGIRVLAKHGRVNLTEDHGRFVTAVFP